MIERIAIVLLGLAIGAAAGVIIWAVRRGNAKRARLATVYYDASQATLTAGDRTVPLQNVRAHAYPPGIAPGLGLGDGRERSVRFELRSMLPLCDERPEDTEPVEVPPPLPDRSQVSVRTIPPAPLEQVTTIREREPLGDAVFGAPVQLDMSGPTEISGNCPKPGGAWIMSDERLRIVPVHDVQLTGFAKAPAPDGDGGNEAA